MVRFRFLNVSTVSLNLKLSAWNGGITLGKINEMLFGGRPSRPNINLSGVCFIGLRENLKVKLSVGNLYRIDWCLQGNNLCYEFLPWCKLFLKDSSCPPLKFYLLLYLIYASPLKCSLVSIYPFLSFQNQIYLFSTIKHPSTPIKQFFSSLSQINQVPQTRSTTSQHPNIQAKPK